MFRKLLKAFVKYLSMLYSYLLFSFLIDKTTAKAAPANTVWKSWMTGHNIPILMCFERHTFLKDKVRVSSCLSRSLFVACKFLNMFELLTSSTKTSALLSFVPMELNSTMPYLINRSNPVRLIKESRTQSFASLLRSTMSSCTTRSIVQLFRFDMLVRFRLNATRGGAGYLLARFRIVAN